MGSLNLILALLSSVLTALITYLLTRRKTDAEVLKLRAEAEKQEIGNTAAFVEFYKKTAEDLMTEVHRLREEVSVLRAEIKQLKMPRR